MRPAGDPPTVLVLLILVALIVAGGAIRLAYARPTPGPFPVDAIYYHDAAANLAAGRGLVVDYSWCYVRGVPESLPVPAMGYWMPGMSLYLAPWIKLLGPSFAVGQLASTVLGMVLIALTWLVGREFAGDGAGLIGAGFAAIDPHLVLLSTTTHAILLQAVFLAAALLFLHRGLQRSPRWLIAAGLCGGLAHLTRNDSVLFVPVAIAAWVLVARKQEGRKWWRDAALFVVPYAAVLAPWMLRNALVFGSAQPAGMYRLAFLADYGDLFRVDWSIITLGRMLLAKGGVIGVLSQDLMYLWGCLKWLAVGSLGLAAIPAAAVLVLKRPRVALAPMLLLALLLVTYSFLLPELGAKGSFRSTGVCLFPMLLSAAGAGLWWLGEWLQRTRGPRARTLLLAGVVAVIALQIGSETHLRITRGYQVIAELPYAAKDPILADLFVLPKPGDRVLMTDDPWTLHRATGRPCVQLPTDGLAAIAAVAERVGARFVVATRGSLASIAGFQEAQDAGELSVLAELPAENQSETLYVVDLHTKQVMSAVNSALSAAEDARVQGDLAGSIASLEQALTAADMYVTPSRIILERLARAHADLAEELLASGDRDKAIGNLRQALELAPEGVDLPEVERRLEELQP